MRQSAIIATTHIDLRGDKFTLEALECLNDTINGDQKVLVTYEHDSMIPPAGKMLSSRIELREDGEHHVVAIQELFENRETVNLKNGTTLLKQECKTDRHPFRLRFAATTEDFVVSFDRVNFDCEDALRDLTMELTHEGTVGLRFGLIGRKALVPDPEIVIQFGRILANYLVAKGLADKVGSKVADLVAEDIAKFYSLLRAVILKSVKYLRPKNRPCTYVFVAAGNPTIEFVARSHDVNLVAGSVLLEKLEAALSNARELHSTLNAVKIQYVLNDAGQWEFNYLLTDAGAVIGTEESFSRRQKRFDLMEMENDSAISSMSLGLVASE